MPEESAAQLSSQRAIKPSFLTKTRFDNLNLPDLVLDGLKVVGFENCTPIQSQVLPISLTGRDIAGQAQTGTGKTAAFLVTVFARLSESPKTDYGSPRALIVAPTRELAYQIHEDAKIIGGQTNLSTLTVVGGIDYQKQADELVRGRDIIIGTPGRIIDYYKQGIFKTDEIKIVVIDEADRLLDLGFAKDMRYILSKLPPFNRRQSMLFSATLSYRVMELTYEYMNLPEFIAVTPEEVTVEGIEQSLYHVGKEQKLELLLGLLEREQWNRILIFANTKVGVDWLNRKLKGNNWPSESITGDMPQSKRFKLMERFKNGSIKILIATDVASRGIHVEDITHVINYDIPQDPENYIHRIGRTARAGKTGHAITLACEKYVFHLEAVENSLGFKIPVVWFEDDWLKNDKAGPVSTERKARRARTTGKKSRTRTKDQRPVHRKTPATTKSTFPGEFFGFRPPAKETVRSKNSDNEAGETPSNTNGKEMEAERTADPNATQSPLSAKESESPKKRRKRRRRKKKPAPKSKTATIAEEASQE